MTSWSDVEENCLLPNDYEFVKKNRISDYPLILDEYFYSKSNYQNISDFPISCHKNINVISKWKPLYVNNELIYDYLNSWLQELNQNDLDSYQKIERIKKLKGKMFYSVYIVGREDWILDKDDKLNLSNVCVLILSVDENIIYSFSHEKNI